MGYTVYTVYSGTVYFVQIVYFRTSKMHTCPLRVSVHCVLCIAYSAANLYSHLKKGLCTWERLCIAYCVLCIGGSTLGAVVYCVLRIVYCVLCIGGSALGAVVYCVLRIVYCVSEAPLWEQLRIVYCVLRIVYRWLRFGSGCVLRIAYCVLRIVYRVQTID